MAVTSLKEAMEILCSEIKKQYGVVRVEMTCFDDGRTMIKWQLYTAENSWSQEHSSFEDALKELLTGKNPQDVTIDKVEEKGDLCRKIIMEGSGI